MAKAIISSILEAQLGKYVDGLSGDSLQLGLWSGELVLQNLSLKPHALAELELPVAVVAGSVRRVHVVVPWNQLGSASVRVALEGVHALVAPSAQLPSRAEQRQAKAAAVARRELRRRHDRFAAARNSSDEGAGGTDESTFLSRLSARIVDNLQVTLRDVHVRYEDSASNPAAPFACGLRIERFAFHTTDAEGRAVFLDRQARGDAFAHKRATLERLGVYWDRVAPGSAQLLQHQPDAARRMAETHERESDHQWLLRPCSLEVQLTKNESDDYARAAKFTVLATLRDVALGLAREQYEDLRFVHEAFRGRRAVEALVLQGRRRPFHDACARPREWWDYAARLARRSRGPATAAATRLRWSAVQRAGAERRAYVAAFRAQLRKGDGGALDPASAHAQSLEAFEATYPVDVIMAARDAAEDAEEAQRREDNAAAASSGGGGGGGGSWYDYFFGGAAPAEPSSPDDELANVLTAQGRADLKQAYDDAATKEQAPSVPRGCNLVAVKLQLKGGSLSLFASAGDAPFVVASADGALALHVQPSDEWDASFRLQRFEVVNCRAPSTSAFRTFCALSSAADPTLPCVRCDASVRRDAAERATLKVRASAVPIRVMVDPRFVLAAQDFFARLLPDQQLERAWSFATSSVADWIFADAAGAAALATAAAAPQHAMRYDVAVDVRAPVFVVPEDVGDAYASVVVVDLGRVAFASDDTKAPLEAGAPATLRWRLDVTNVQVLLGRLRDLDWAADAELARFAKLVREFSVAFGVETLALTPPPTAASGAHPSTSVQATIPQIAVSLAEDQLVTLARIHSSMLAQAALVGGRRQPRDAAAVTADAVQPPPSEATQPTTAAAAAAGVGADAPDTYHLQVRVSLGEVVVNLRESAARDALRLRVTQTSFDAGVFASQYVLQARLQSLAMEDMLYDPASSFRYLMATGAAAQDAHLVAIDVTLYPSPPRESRSSSSAADREASFLVVDAKFNVLDVQWNPSSMSLLYRIATAYVGALQHHSIGSDAVGAPQIRSSDEPQPRPSGGDATPPAPPPPTPSQLPAVVARASLVQVSVTFNKDELRRQLVKLAMKDASVEFASRDGGAYEWTGHVGNFLATDLSLAKHPVYAPLVGLDAAAAAAKTTTTKKTALLAFSYAFEPTTSDKSVLALRFQPVRMVYYHQQVLELADYLFEGILGAMVTQTLASATQLLLSEAEASVVLDVAFERPTLVLPVRMADPDHVRITAERVSLRHSPTSAVHLLGAGPLAARTRVVALGEASAGRRDDCVSLRVDYKQVSLKSVTILCVSEPPANSSSSSGGGATATASSSQQRVVARPMDLEVDVEDLASAAIRVGDEPFLPRFRIRVAVAELLLLLQRRDYVLFVGLLADNFGAEQLEVASSSSNAVESSDSGRPNVAYTYSRTDLEAATMELSFAMQSVRCVLFEEEDTSQDVAGAGRVASEALDAVARAGERATSELVARDLALSLAFVRDANPSLAVSVASFVARALAGADDDDDSSSSAAPVGSESRGVLLVCTQPTQVAYAWDEQALTCELALTLSSATGVLVPEPLLGLADFFALPPPAPPSRAERVTRRPSRTPESAGVAYALTVRLSATQLAVDVPQDLEHPESARLSLGADVTAAYTWKPASAPDATAADLDIQSSLVVDARAIEVVVKNASRQGCHAAATASDSAGLATRVQLLEPCELRVEVSDLFPHAGQRQQIVALRFSPIEAFASYDDACIAAATLRTLSESAARYARKKQQQQQQQQQGEAVAVNAAGGVLSPKAFAAAAADVEIHRYFTCEVSSMQLTVINDCDGCDMGLLQAHVTRGNAFLNVTYAAAPTGAKAKAPFPPPATVLSGGGGVAMRVAYYNPDTRSWHELSREWGVDVSLQGAVASSSDASASGNELHVIVTASQPLELLVTHGLLEVAASAGGAWNRRASSGAAASPPSPTTAASRKKHAPCVISNETGLPVRFWLTNGQATTPAAVVRSGELADLHYVHAAGRGSGVVRQYASSDRSAAAALRLCVALEDAAFQPVQGIIFEQLGSRAFALVDPAGSLTPFALNCHATLVDGRILLALSSQVKLVSHLARPVQLLVNDPTWRAPVAVGVLHPGRESAVPVLLALGSELRVRPLGDAFAWSAPIPVQTRAALEQTVEASSADGPSAVFCVALSLEQSLRVVCLSDPIVVVNKLPVALEFSVASAASAASPASHALGVGARGGVWWTDSAQRPQFQLRVGGCRPSKWLALVRPGAKAAGEVFSVALERRDGRALKVLVQVEEHAAKAVHVFLYAEMWLVNRTGLELTYGNDSDAEAYVPPMDARALVGNAQLCAFSSDASAGPPVVRLRVGASRWSARVVADPRKLSWQDECLTVRADREGGGSMLYELGVSADYATRHFGAITTLVSVIPRYLVLNRTAHTVLLLEDAAAAHGSGGGDAAHHILARGDAYALYWVTGGRRQLRVSVVGAHRDFGWSPPVSVDTVASRDVALPAAAAAVPGDSLTLQLSVKRGSISQATFVVEITEADAAAAGDAASPVAAASGGGWDTFSVHTQIAGVVVTLADRKQRADDGAERKPKAKARGRDEPHENVARLAISRISVESNVSPLGTSAKMNVMGVQVEDLLADSKHPVVLRPVARPSAPYDPYHQQHRSSSSGGGSKHFLEVAYVEKPHARFTWVDRLRVELQDVKITTSMRFVDRLNGLVRATVAHFQSRSLSSSSRAASSLREELESDARLLEYFAASDDAASMASLTGRKLYIASGEIAPVRVVVSFSRGKGGATAQQGFWLAHLKLEIENACVTLGAFKIAHALATQEALLESLAGFYVQSVKSQALGLLDAVQVTSLVTSMVTGGVSSLVSTLLGKTDPALAATAAHSFQYQFLTNAQLVDKHSRLLAQCRSSAQFLAQLRHLVFDWDSNHTGLEARGCVALGLVNNSRHPLVVNARLNDGAELRVLPLGRRSLAGVADGDWRADRALVLFAWGYTPTLLTSGDVYFTAHSNACNVFVTRKAARLKANLGYTATFTHQEAQSWWATNVVIVGDDIQAHTPGISQAADAGRMGTTTATSTSISSGGNGDAERDAAAAYDLFGGGGDGALVPTGPTAQDEYEVVFSSASLGIIAKQSGRAVIVRELCALPSGAPGPALATGEIAPGDSILTVSGMTVTNTTQFAQLVSRSPRPVVLRFRRTSESATYSSLFGEAPRSRETSGGGGGGGDDSDESFDLFGGGR